MSRNSRTILVVEDDPEIRDLMHALLEMDGFQPILLASSIGAHAAIRAAQPDLVITDLEIEEPEAGMRLLEQLRADAATSHIPVILYSGSHNFLEENRRAIKRLGAVALRKPFELDHLTRLIEAALAAA